MSGMFQPRTATGRRALRSDEKRGQAGRIAACNAAWRFTIGCHDRRRPRGAVPATSRRQHVSLSQVRGGERVPGKRYLGAIISQTNNSIAGMSEPCSPLMVISIV